MSECAEASVSAACGDPLGVAVRHWEVYQGEPDRWDFPGHKSERETDQVLV